ncbi:MAG: hypothetical protein PVS3B1_27740 [Ktedonobacteraceae bacterium]
MHHQGYQGRALIASVIFALLVYLLVEMLTDLHQRMQMLLVLHPQIVPIMVLQMILTCIALFVHYSKRRDRMHIGNSIAAISLLLTLYITWLCYH